MDPQHTNTLPFITCFHGVYDPQELDSGDNLFFETIFTNPWVTYDQPVIRAEEAPPTILTLFTDKPPEDISQEYEILKYSICHSRI